MRASGVRVPRGPSWDVFRGWQKECCHLMSSLLSSSSGLVCLGFHLVWSLFSKTMARDVVWHRLERPTASQLRVRGPTVQGDGDRMRLLRRHVCVVVTNIGQRQSSEPYLNTKTNLHVWRRGGPGVAHRATSRRAMAACPIFVLTQQGLRPHVAQYVVVQGLLPPSRAGGEACCRTGVRAVCMEGYIM